MEMIFILFGVFIGLLFGVGGCIFFSALFPSKKELIEVNEKLEEVNKELTEEREEKRRLNRTLAVRNQYLNRTNPDALRWLELNRTVDELSRQKIILSKDKMVLESDIAALEKLLQERKEEYFNNCSKN